MTVSHCGPGMRVDGSQRFTTAFELIERWVGFVFKVACGNPGQLVRLHTQTLPVQASLVVRRIRIIRFVAIW
jgi:hypothetical protein